MLALNQLKKSSGKKKAVKRKGRGNASGRGNYSTKGMKGQRARSGGRAGLAGRSIKSYLLRIPKVRGFNSLQAEMAIVNVGRLNIFEEGATLNARELLKAGLIKNIDNGVKILSQGKLVKKGLKVQANAFSKEAVKKIEALGGQVLIVALKKNKSKAKVDKKIEDKK